MTRVVVIALDRNNLSLEIALILVRGCHVSAGSAILHVSDEHEEFQPSPEHMASLLFGVYRTHPAQLDFTLRVARTEAKLDLVCVIVEPEQVISLLPALGRIEAVRTVDPADVQAAVAVAMDAIPWVRQQDEDAVVLLACPPEPVPEAAVVG